MKKERRYNQHGAIVKMAEADGWILARRPHKIPFAISKMEWDRLPTSPDREFVKDILDADRQPPEASFDNLDAMTAWLDDTSTRHR